MDAVSFLRRAGNHRSSSTAVVHPNGSITYGELLRRANHVAQRLPRPDLGPQPIVVVTEHDPATPEIYFGVMAAGHSIVPVSARLPDPAIERIASAAGARLGLVGPDHAGRVAGLNQGAGATRWVEYDSDVSIGVLPEPGAALPAGTAMVAFTSGTTGDPKGVLVTHTNLIANGLTAALVFGVGAVNCHINPLPLAHFAGASRVILAAVNAGTHVILPEFDPVGVLDAIEEFRGTHLTVAPAMARELLRAEPERFDLESLETLVYGTAPMPSNVVSELLERLDCDLINGYGLTESTGLVTALDADHHRQAARAGDEDMLSSIGWPVPGVELRIIDDAHRDVQKGATGEIALRGMKITPGYLSNPEETASRYLNGGWLRSGDQGRLADAGYLLLTGRIDDMIITGGLNVQPLEVEIEAIRFQGVEACAAFGVPSDQWGQEIRLAVVPASGWTVPVEELRVFLQGRLDRYKVPKMVHIVDRLPRSSLGKVQRRELSARFGHERR
ncbi:MAG: acyl--CoA ligase [Acidimicrobiia bacterium]|nr:acyl--CoA ligase [Acidimicrobiia bacterium]